MKLRRREWLSAVAGSPLLAVAAGCGAKKAEAPKAEPAKASLELSKFEPKSMLVVPETKVEKSSFPVIDIHTHLCWSVKSENGVALAEERQYLDPPEELLKVMERRNLKTLVNLTGGFGNGLKDAVQKYDAKYPGRFITFAEPMWHRTNEPGYPKMQADAIAQAQKDGAKGLKVLKTLGLYLRENVTTGALVKIDDPRFDPMWEACGALNMPVTIHIGDPAAFFTPIDASNERWEELANHPDWSFYGKDFPQRAELLEARNRVVARHPKTQFIGLHVANSSENLAPVGEWFDKYPNLTCEIGARIGELGRQPRTSRKFFEKYQDRILFGTDAVPHGDEYPQQVYGDLLYQIYYRFLETEDEYFDYAPAKIPPQGRWRIYGLGLPKSILKKVYHDNAARLLKL